MKDLVRIEDRPYLKEYNANIWDVSHGTLFGPIVVQERQETQAHNIVFGNSSYANTTRGVVINTTAFDIEVVPVFVSLLTNHYLIGICLKETDAGKFFMPMAPSSASVMFGPLTTDLITLRTDNDDYGDHDYTELHYDPSHNPWIAAYTAFDNYKHYFHSFPMRYAYVAKVLAGHDITTDTNLINSPILFVEYGYQYSWFTPTNTSVDMIFVPALGYPVFTDDQYDEVEATGNLCNLAFTTYDGNSLNSLMSNADIIRGNIWAQADTGQGR